MSQATLQVSDLRGGMKRYVLDCAHGTTTGHATNDSELSDPTVVAALVIKHHGEEGCGCTNEPSRKYPPTLVPNGLWMQV